MTVAWSTSSRETRLGLSRELTWLKIAKAGQPTLGTGD
jgi:hypothetical protein